ncbi:hypothetical protein BCV69DRAFT_273137 [Microstroma glucosiphilum]|uniref:Protein BCP1 n=1 Tax=Pseudomicrostroma glucosiphilum TaxID=1684307 RepID=A0A316U1J0_9BASI|nr:hypothetical protein BCV69DRAFT_273137 [Pseudomicrostroma glucosiphilum]PWN18714.1 hypothetical protein BCV69DRAFT_273137 [Pseudomicrostroma glucosiphilum]
MPLPSLEKAPKATSNNSAAKRKATTVADADGDVPLAAAGADATGGDDSDSGDSDASEDPTFINVDFDFRAPAEVDEAALRRLLRQLFHTHANDLELYKVSEEMIRLAAGNQVTGEGGMGTVIKVEGDEDQAPFAFVTGIELNVRQPSNAASSLLTTYLASQLPATSPISSVLSSSSTSSPASKPWLFLHERFINLPAQVAPPLYRLLTEEIIASMSSSGAGEPSHAVFFGRVFSKEAYSDDEDEPMNGPGGAAEDDEDKPRGMKGAKRRKGITKKAKLPVNKGERRDWGYFRPEDELLEKHASHTHTYRFPPPQNAEDSYESPLYGRIVLVEWEKVKSGALWDQLERELTVQAMVAEQQ